MKYLCHLLVPISLFTLHNFVELKSQNTDLWLGAGVSLEMGQPIRRMGGFVRAYGIYGQFQLNSEVRLHYQFSTFGPSQKGWELQTGTGLVFFWDENEQNSENPFFSLVSQQANYHYSVAYAYQYYWDKQATSQATGMIAFGLNEFQMIVENDILGKAGEDKFRTGTVLLQYQDSVQQIGVKSILWTGKATGVEKGRNTEYPSRFGYLEMTQSKYGNLSHGILGGYYHYFWQGQVLGANLGIDSERVRHALQNRLIHDLIFIPKSWNPPPNKHIPMIDAEGELYLFLDNQKIRPSKPYFQLSVNPSLFY